MNREEAEAANHARTCSDCRRPRLATSKYVALRDVQHYCLRDYITVENRKPETLFTVEGVLEDCREIAAARRHGDSCPERYEDSCPECRSVVADVADAQSSPAGTPKPHTDRFSIHPGLAIWDEHLCWDGSFRYPIAVAHAATIARCPSGLVVNGLAAGVGSVVRAGDVVEWSPTLLEGNGDDLWVEVEIQDEEDP